MLHIIENKGLKFVSYQINNIQIAYVLVFYEGWNFNSGNYLFTTDTK